MTGVSQLDARVRTDPAKSWNLKVTFSGLESFKIRPKSWKVMEMRIALVTYFSMISD